MTNEHEVRLDSISDADRAYFGRRAQWHADRAERATDDATRALHHKFARSYEARAKG